MCVNFTDLNKASPNDHFLLSHIDQLVNITSGHQTLNFMDAFFRYNQILMAKEDKEKTTFITDSGMYCWVSMQ